MYSAILYKAVCYDIYIYSINFGTHQNCPSAHSLDSTSLTYSVRLVEFCTYSKLNSVIHLVL